MLALLERRVEREGKRGLYDEIDSPYGAVDPTLDLARTLALGGEARRAEAQLRDRARRYAAFLNDEELVAVLETLRHFPLARRRAWWPRLRNWARKADRAMGLQKSGYYEAALLARGPSPEIAERDLLALLAKGRLGSPALRGVLRSPEISDRVRTRFRRALVATLERDARGLSDPKANPFEHSRRVRHVCCGAMTVAELSDELGARERAVVAKACRSWNRWLTGAVTTDWLDAAQTAVAFTSAWAPEIQPAVALVRERTPTNHLVSVDGWERLYSRPQLARFLARLEA
jgi:hypothetical protein